MIQFLMALTLGLLLGLILFNKIKDLT